jgi:hypothetical protein
LALDEKSTVQFHDTQGTAAVGPVILSSTGIVFTLAQKLEIVAYRLGNVPTCLD